MAGAHGDDDGASGAGAVYTLFFKKATAPGAVTQNLEAWYDANQGVSIDANDLASAWADKSPNGIVATQLTSSFQPRREKSALNGNAALNFDGVDNRMQISDISNFPAGSAPIHVFGVANHEDTAGGRDRILTYGTDAA